MHVIRLSGIAADELSDKTWNLEIPDHGAGSAPALKGGRGATSIAETIPVCLYPVNSAASSASASPYSVTTQRQNRSHSTAHCCNLEALTPAPTLAARTSRALSPLVNPVVHTLVRVGGGQCYLGSLYSTTHAGSTMVHTPYGAKQNKRDAAQPTQSRARKQAATENGDRIGRMDRESNSARTRYVPRLRILILESGPPHTILSQRS
jgi:hypothetical protein